MSADQPIFHWFVFNGWVFEFHVDYFEAVNPANRDRYRIYLDPYEVPPFRIQLIEKGQ
jgi:hypothetical protein